MKQQERTERLQLRVSAEERREYDAAAIYEGYPTTGAWVRITLARALLRQTRLRAVEAHLKGKSTSADQVGRDMDRILKRRAGK